jgi:tetratricopeptide (TPR) repeat protein
MPQNASLKKVIIAGVVVAACGGGLYWKLVRGPAAGPVDLSATPLFQLRYDQLGSLSPHDRSALAGAEELFHSRHEVAALNRLEDFETRGDPPSPGYLRATLLAGQCLVNLGQFQEAERAFRFVAEERPREPDAHRGLALVYHQVIAISAEEYYLAKVAELDPGDTKALGLLMAYHLDRKRFDMAEDDAREGLKRNPPPEQAAGFKEGLTEALIGLNRFADGLAVAPTDDTPIAQSLRAECLRNLSRRREAANEVRAGLAAKEIDPKARIRLLTEDGWLRAESGDDDGAVKSFAAVVAADEHNLGARLQLSLALRRLGQSDRADAEEAKFKASEEGVKGLSELNKQAGDRPWDAALRRELANAYRKMNLPAMADFWLRAAEACEPKRKP